MSEAAAWNRFEPEEKFKHVRRRFPRCQWDKTRNTSNLAPEPTLQRSVPGLEATEKSGMRRGEKSWY